MGALITYRLINDKESSNNRNGLTLTFVTKMWPGELVGSWPFVGFNRIETSMVKPMSGAMEDGVDDDFERLSKVSIKLGMALRFYRRSFSTILLPSLRARSLPPAPPV